MTRAWGRRHRPDGRAPRPRGPPRRTTPGRSMLRSTSPWPTARRSVGCGSSTRPPAPSWGRRFSPRGFWSQVDPRATQATLRELFVSRGLPRRMRVDNGMPWGSQGDLPTDLACWLGGLGVGMVLTPPRRPEDNGVVERFQGVGKSWGEPERCRSAAELQRRLDELDRWQRDLYPIARGRSRREVYPGLEHSGRPYDPADEPALWQLGRAWAWVGQHLVARLVDSQGKVSLYNRPYTVGLRWSRRKIWVGFDPVRGEWMFQDEKGYEIRRQAATELSAEKIVALEVTNRRRGIHAAKTRERTGGVQPTKR